MTTITKPQYLQALSICQQYRAQINNEVDALQDLTIREFIQSNLGQMSTRCFNMLERAIAKGCTTTSELTAAKLMNIPGVGIGTIKEFQKILNHGK